MTHKKDRLKCSSFLLGGRADGSILCQGERYPLLSLRVASCGTLSPRAVRRGGASG